MQTEEKNLLLRDLCARLPYGVFVEENRTKLDPGPVIYTYDYHPCIDNCKPYLRPMSSMTEEEREEVSDYLCERVMSNKSGITFPPDPIHGKGIPFEWMSSCIDWLNAHHFDYRGLIEKGLALEAPEDMYK